MFVALPCGLTLALSVAVALVTAVAAWVVVLAGLKTAWLREILLLGRLLMSP
jgi:hypothetical protein